MSFEDGAHTGVETFATMVASQHLSIAGIDVFDTIDGTRATARRIGMEPRRLRIHPRT
jgi:hypothetical protein